MNLIIVLDTVDSTQDELVRRLDSDEDIDAILASEQTSGRGRIGRSWLSPKGSFALSFVWRAAAKTPWLPGLALTAGVVAAEVFDTKIAWPNDLIIGGKKVGGILSEIVTGIPIIGIGVNLRSAPPEIPWSTHLAGKVDPLRAACVLLDKIQDTEIPSHFSQIKRRWEARDATPGKNYKLPDGRIAIAKSVSENGELIAVAGKETVTIPSAEAIHGSGS